MRVRLKQSRLLDLMAQSSLSQNHWAIKLGLSRGHWSAIVNGRHPFPSPRTRDRMLEVFRVGFDELFEVESGPAEGADATFQAALAERYLIDREVGQGGMGTVYLARDVKHNRMVALKVVSPEAVSGIGAHQFLKEIRYTARLQHHNILPLYDSGEAAGYPFYVTPYIEAGSLRQHMERRGALSVAEALQIARGIGAALQHAHEHSVLHCDVKPENVLVSDAHAYVADFGISRAVHAEFFEWGKRSELDSSAGTPAYVSPEQASGERHLDGRSDVYSFACVVFEMLAGRPPFHGTTTLETVAQRFTAVPELKRYAPHVSQAVAKVIAAGMAVRIENRPETPADFVRALEAAAAQERSRTAEAAGAVWSRLSRVARAVIGLRPSTRRQKFMDSVLQDLRFAFRSLRRQPMMTAMVGLTLALGIGMNTAIFSVLYGVLFQPLPYEQPEQLMRIGRTRPELPDVLLPISVPNFLDFKPQISQLTSFEAETGTMVIVESDDLAIRVRGLQVTPGFFDLFGVPAQLGRTLVPEDGAFGAEKVVVLSDGFWRDRLGADSSVVGTTIRLSDNPYTIAGIMPPGFDFGGSLWIPFQWNPDNLPTRGSNFLRLYGRLAPGVEVEALTEELHTLWTALGEQNAGNYDESGMRAEPLLQALVSRSRTPLFILAGAVGLVLLVACANVVNMMLARSEARHREMAVRAALGAGRGRLVRQFLTESLVLALTGGFVGIAAAYAGLRTIVAIHGSAIPRADDLGINGIVLGFAVLVSVATGVLVGLVPALQAKPDHSALKEGGRGASAGSTAIRKGLVIAEVALALMLVTGTGVLLKSFWRAQQSDMGFNGENLLVLNLWLPPSRYQNTADRTAFFESLLPQLSALPGVQHAAMSNMIPARSYGSNYTTIGVAGRDDDRESHFVEARRVSQTYFETMGMRLTRGRNFTAADADSAGNAIIINEELVRQLFDEDENPLGARLGDGWSNPPEIVGVVNDVRSFGPDERPRPTIYWPVHVSSNLVLRTAGDPLQAVPSVRQTLSVIDPAVKIYRVDSMADILTRSLGDRRFQLALLIVFGGVALVLGAVGIYGVMSYTVVQRTRELGVRLALGSSTGGVLRLVMGQGTLLALIGVAVGAVGAFATRRVLANLVFDVSTSDPLTYGVVAVLLTSVAALACYLPARRAAKVDPMKALRYE